LVVAFADGTFRVFEISPDATQAKELFDLAGHTGFVEAVTFSPDGKRFATASDDNTAKMWDAATGQELLTLLGHTGGVHGVAFSPDGTHLATAGGDGLVRTYLLRIEDLVTLAKSRLTRTWTTAECQKYLHVEACPAEPAP
jgi:WD40 repeat protein